MNKVIIKVLLLTIVLTLLLTGSFAKKYSAKPSGQGISTVGAGGDYASLYEASNDFNATLPTGSWTLYILNNLTENNPCFFGNTVGAGTTNTIKPAKGVNAVITFNSSGSFLAGNLVFGSKLNSIDALIPTNNFTIDGSNNGTQSRNLTLITSSKTSCAYSYTVRVFGDCDNVVIKNTNILDFAGTVNWGAAIGYCTRSTSRTFSAIPDNGRIENCYVLASTMIVGGTRAAITFENNGNLPPGAAARNFSIVSSTIISYNIPRGIFISGAVGDGVISANTVRSFLPTGVSVGLYPIIFNGSNRLTSFTLSNNVLDKMETGKTSAGEAIIAININGKSQGNGTSGTFNCFNNIITGFKLTGSATTTAMKIGGIRHYSISETVNCINNSINIPDLGSGWTGLTNCYAIGFECAVYNGSACVENNIIRVHQKGFVGIAKQNSGLSNAFVADYNNIVALSGAYAYRWGNAYYPTLANVQNTFAKEIHSQSVDPLETHPDHWVSESDLHFTGTNANPLKPGTPFNLPITIVSDVDGQYRSATAPWAGADEPTSTSDNIPTGIFSRLKGK